MDIKKVLLFGVAAGLAAALSTCSPTIPETTDTPFQNETQNGSGSSDAEPIAVEPTPVDSIPGGRVESAISQVRDRNLSVDHGFWTVFHGILGLGPNLTITHPTSGMKVNALQYICDGGKMRGLNFRPSQHGLDVVLQADGIGFGQGHQDQFIAEMGQWGIAPDRKFRLGKHDYTFMDFVAHSQKIASLKKNQELSWTIIVVGQFLGMDIQWMNEDGDELKYEDMIRYELDQPVESAACGGTHRLFGLSWCLHMHLQKGGKVEGIWKEVNDKTIKYRDLAKKYQNPDGSFSTSYFRGPAQDQGITARISSTGHILEWLSLALSPEELQQEWVESAANALSLMILDNANNPVEGGAIYHAVHGLLMYYSRIHGPEKLGPNKPYMILAPDWSVLERK